MDVWLGGRLLLAPREANLPLLQAVLTATVPGSGGLKGSENVYDLQVTWAQIALVYRQRDFERIMDLCNQELRVSTSSTETKRQSTIGEDVEPSPTPTLSAGSHRSHSLRYCFNIGAPLLFLPASTGKKCDSGVMDPSIGGLSMASSSSSRSFQPLRDEGYAVLDFGNCLVQSDPSNPSAVRISMTRLQVFFAAPEDHQRWHQILRPVTAEVEVQSTAESLDIRVHAPLEKVEALDVGPSLPLNPLKPPSRPASPKSGLYKPRPHPTISLTRAHATQFFDVLYLNLSYASADQVSRSVPARHSKTSRNQVLR